jgi:hypothetical protein
MMWVPESARQGTRYFDVQDFTEPKDSAIPERNEDVGGIGAASFVLADGSTPKAGNAGLIDGCTGGRIAADTVVLTALAHPRLHGRRLVDAMTANLAGFYQEHNPEALRNRAATFAATFVRGSIDGAELVITSVGDTRYRVNGGQTMTEEREIDRLDAAVRAEEIHRLLAQGVTEEEAVALGRRAIEPSLNQQWRLWNSPEPVDLGVGYGPVPGFGYVNGLHVPDDYIHVKRFPLREVRTVEVWTDGYPKAAVVEEGAVPTFEDWEAAYREVQATDPPTTAGF